MHKRGRETEGHVDDPECSRSLLHFILYSVTPQEAEGSRVDEIKAKNDSKMATVSK